MPPSTSFTPGFSTASEVGPLSGRGVGMDAVREKICELGGVVTVTNSLPVKNAVIPVVTIFGIQFAQIFSATVIIENIFQLPGVGRFLFDAILQRDYPVIQGINLVIVSIIVLINLAVDLCYGVLDPRIRYS